MNESDYIEVTEKGGEFVSRGQLDRFYQRYIWAGTFCVGKSVLEMACGTGPGLGHLLSISEMVTACDISNTVLDHARKQYGDRIAFHQSDAARTPFDNQTFDVIVLFEAIYYIENVAMLINEVVRLLRPGGVFLIATANKDLFDFNPSPFSHSYFNAPELFDLLESHGFESKFYGGSPVPESTAYYRILRQIKRAAVTLNLVPGSMRGKRYLKRMLFGKLVEMPLELRVQDATYHEPQQINANEPNDLFQVIYCVATRR